MTPNPCPFLASCIIAGIVLFSTGARGAEFQLETMFDSEWSSNLFLDGDEEADVALRPGLSLGAGFGEHWFAGYSGELSAFVKNTDLLSHFHTLYLGARPVFGSEILHEITAELTLNGLFNRELYDAIDMFNPTLKVDWLVEPLDWLRPEIGVAAEYRWFYNDSPSSSMDLWLNTGLALTAARTRTTFRPTANLGYRLYTENSQSDLQADVGLRVSQGLWKTAGLQGSYFYRFADGENEVVARNLTLDQFAYVGEEFLFAGHRGHLGFKQLIFERFSAQLGAAAEERRYKSWPALDVFAFETGSNRHDIRLAPSAQISFEQLFENDRQSELAVHLGYRFIRQWSNDPWYDTVAHDVYLSLWGAF